jgi:hypothetical protein
VMLGFAHSPGARLGYFGELREFLLGDCICPST